MKKLIQDFNLALGGFFLLLALVSFFWFAFKPHLPENEIIGLLLDVSPTAVRIFWLTWFALMGIAVAFFERDEENPFLGFRLVFVFFVVHTGVQAIASNFIFEALFWKYLGIAFGVLWINFLVLELFKMKVLRKKEARIILSTIRLLLHIEEKKPGFPEVDGDTRKYLLGKNLFSKDNQENAILTTRAKNFLKEAREKGHHGEDLKLWASKNWELTSSDIKSLRRVGKKLKLIIII